MNVLAFAAEGHEGLKGHVEPLIDGQPLSALVKAFEIAKGYTDPAGGYAGISCARRLPQPMPPVAEFVVDDPLFPRDGAKRPVFLGCQCGEWGCWPLLGRVFLDGETVTWDNFTNPFRQTRDYSEFGPFHFAIKEYFLALLNGMALSSRQG